MLTTAKIAEHLEALRNYQFNEGTCHLCGEPCSTDASAVLHQHCAFAYQDLKEELTMKIFKKLEDEH